jgi:hypothetical protein
MSWRARIKALLTAMIAFPLLVGCGQGFQSEIPNENFDYTFKVLPSHVGDGVALDEYSENIRSHNTGEANTAGLGFGGQVSIVAGPKSLDRDLDSILNDNLDFTTAELTADLLVNFGQVQPALKMGHHLARVTTSERCASLTGEMAEVDPASDYNCGEVPIGEILPDGRKRLLTVETPEVRETGDPEVHVPSSTVKLYLHRNQSAGVVEIDDLDTLKRTEVTTGERIFDQSYFRLYPNAGDLNMQFCTLIPGLAVSSDTVVIKGSGKKGLGLGLSARADVQVRVDIGQLSFDSAQICSSFRLVNTADGKVQFDFVDVQIPQLKNLIGKGIHVKTKVDAKGLIGLLVDFLKIFTLDLEEMVEDMANEMILEEAEDFAVDILKEHVSSGEYIKELLVRGGLYSKVIPEIEAQVNDVLSQVGPGTSMQMESWFGEACEELESGDELLTMTSPLLALCKSTASFKSLMFLKDPISHLNGCYSHFMPVGALSTHEGKWWSKNCKFRTRIQVTLSMATGPLYACLIHHLNYDSEGLSETGACQDEIDILEEAWNNFDQQDREELLERLGEVKQPDPEEIEEYGIIIQEQLNGLFD